MGAIGGIMELKGNSIDFGSLNRMRIAMSLRCRVRSSAFLGGSIGMLFGSSSPGAFDSEADKMPYICERRGRKYVLCIDGEGFSSSAVLEKYMIHGAEFLGALDGAFALALYDGEKDMLILATDKQGRRPLFYRVYENSIVFSSEIKGILGCLEGQINIDGDALAMHLISPAGAYRGENIYSDIKCVQAGQCVLFTSVGYSRFFYRENRGTQQVHAKRIDKERALVPYARADSKKLNEYLCGALLAFDYPQFDCYMPSVMELFDNSFARGQYRLCFEDNTRSRNYSYSYEREDCLSALCGVSGEGILCHNGQGIDGEYLCCLHRELYTKLASSSSVELSVFRYIFGTGELDSLMDQLDPDKRRTKDTERSIRILGMLCQTVDWVQSRRLVIKREEKNRPLLI